MTDALSDDDAHLFEALRSLGGRDPAALVAFARRAADADQYEIAAAALTRALTVAAPREASTVDWAERIAARALGAGRARVALALFRTTLPASPPVLGEEAERDSRALARLARGLHEGALVPLLRWLFDRDEARARAGLRAFQSERPGDARPAFMRLSADTVFSALLPRARWFPLLDGLRPPRFPRLTVESMAAIGFTLVALSVLGAEWDRRHPRERVQVRASVGVRALLTRGSGPEPPSPAAPTASGAAWTAPPDAAVGPLPVPDAIVTLVADVWSCAHTASLRARVALLAHSYEAGCEAWAADLASLRTALGPRGTDCADPALARLVRATPACSHGVEP